MTVCIAARFDEGVICATDSAIVTGSNRITLPHIKGQYVWENFVMYAGVLADAQKVLRKTDEMELLDAVLECQEEAKDEGEEGADFLIVYKPDLKIETIDSNGACIAADQWAAIGHGADSARMLLEALYKPRGETFVKTTLKTILQIISKYDNTVFGPVRFEVIR